MPATAAFAWPGEPPRSEVRYDRLDRDHRYESRWMTLSRATPARQGRDTVTLRGPDRRIDRLKIEADRGAPRIRRVIVQYANREVERLPVDVQLARGQQQIIQLDRDRRVARITVETDPRFAGAYSLYGT